MFDQYPDNQWTHPRSDPAVLVSMVETPAMGPRAIAAAQACLANRAWEHLEALVKAGFDISGNHASGVGEVQVCESLLYRTLRVHLFDNLAERLSRLLALGANPHQANGQGITPAGLLCWNARDLPLRITCQALELLESHGVSMLEPCADNSTWSRMLLPGVYARDILANRCPELLPWLQQRELEAATPPAHSTRPQPRL